MSKKKQVRKVCRWCGHAVEEDLEGKVFPVGMGTLYECKKYADCDKRRFDLRVKAGAAARAEILQTW